MASAAPSPPIAADKAQPNQSVNFALMIHKIHTGEKMTANSDRATPSSDSAEATTTSPKSAIPR